MAATPSIKVEKTFTYRQVAGKVFSNRYHFNGGTPADTAHWTTLSDAVVTAEKAIHLSGVVIVKTIGYAAGSEIPVFSKTYSTAGTLSSTGAFPVQGDTAGIIRYATTARTGKNHPIYLYNYYHGVAMIGGTSNDTMLASQVTAMGVYAAAWIAGLSDGTTTYNRAGPNGATATGYIVNTLLTHRDLKR